MRVLVVEDEEAVGDLFIDYLLELGHEPVLVRSAEAALGRLQTDRPDAILLDINLPGMSGLDFLQLGRVRALGLPVIAVSGVVTESQARECLRLGAVDFVGKPVAVQRLGDVLDCVEPHARERREEHRQNADRRRAPRAAITFPVRVIEYSGTEWRTMSLTLSPSAVKIRSPHAGERPKAVRLELSLPDTGPPVTVTSVLIREDREGPTYFFANLSAFDSGRLRDLVTRSPRV